MSGQVTYTSEQVNIYTTRALGSDGKRFAEGKREKPTVTLSDGLVSGAMEEHSRRKNGLIHCCCSPMPDAGLAPGRQILPWGVQSWHGRNLRCTTAELLGGRNKMPWT